MFKKNVWGNSIRVLSTMATQNKENEIEEIKLILQQIQSLNVPYKKSHNLSDQDEHLAHKNNADGLEVSHEDAIEKENPKDLGSEMHSSSSLRLLVYASLFFIACAVGAYYFVSNTGSKNNNVDYASTKKELEAVEQKITSLPEKTDTKPELLADKETTPIVTIAVPKTSEVKKTLEKIKEEKPQKVSLQSKDIDLSQQKKYKAAENAIAKARNFMKKGEVLAAREILLKQSKVSSEADGIAFANISLTLAKLYDPNFLKVLPSVDTDADVIEAEHWYRKWHEVSVAQGLLNDEKSLKRFLNAMR